MGPTGRSEGVWAPRSGSPNRDQGRVGLNRSVIKSRVERSEVVQSRPTACLPVWIWRRPDCESGPDADLGFDKIVPYGPHPRSQTGSAFLHLSSSFLLRQLNVNRKDHPWTEVFGGMYWNWKRIKT